MIVGERVFHSWYKLVLVAAVGGNSPDSLDNLGRERDGLGLLKNLQILVADHVEEHRIQGLVARRKVGGKPARSDQHIIGVGEVPVVLTIDK